MMFSIEPLEALLPGTWILTFVDEQNTQTGAGKYTFKLAGVFNADVRDDMSGRANWHGYWQVEDARLKLTAQQMTSWCSSCLDGGMSYEWVIELEQVQEAAFGGTAIMANGEKRQVVFERTT